MTDQATLEALGHELFKGKAINHQAWKLDDPDWVKQREELWEKDIDRRIKSDYLDLSKTKVRTYERYFLQGKIPKFNPETLVSVNLAFMCWLHPDHSDENFQLIKGVIWLIGGEYAVEHYRQSIPLICGGGFMPEEGYPGGLMGDLAIRIFELLVDEDISNPFVKFNYDERLTKLAGYEKAPYSNAFEYATGSTFITNPDSYTCTNYVWQYDRPLEYFYASIDEDEIDAVFARKASLRGLNKYLKALAEFDSTVDPSHYKSIYVEKVRKIFNERPLPEKFKEHWEEAKQNALNPQDSKA